MIGGDTMKHLDLFQTSLLLSILAILREGSWFFWVGTIGAALFTFVFVLVTVLEAMTERKAKR